MTLWPLYSSVQYCPATSRFADAVQYSDSASDYATSVTPDSINDIGSGDSDVSSDESETAICQLYQVPCLLTRKWKYGPKAAYTGYSHATKFWKLKHWRDASKGCMTVDSFFKVNPCYIVYLKLKLTFSQKNRVADQLMSRDEDQETEDLKFDPVLQSDLLECRYNLYRLIIHISLTTYPIRLLIIRILILPFSHNFTIFLSLSLHTFRLRVSQIHLLVYTPLYSHNL